MVYRKNTVCGKFGNKCFYGIGIRVVDCHKYRKQVFLHPTKATKVEWVHEPRGVFISHVLVIVNKTIQASHSRARYYMPRCEFRHGPRDGLRKYPDVRLSVFSDTPQNSAYENWGKPEDMPSVDTHSNRYPLVTSKALSMDPPKIGVGADADVDLKSNSGEEDKRRKHCDRMVEKKVMDWSSFRQARPGWTKHQLLQQWRTYPRVARPVTDRMFRDQRLSWTECTQRFGDYYDRSELHKWYTNLPRVASR